MTSEVIAPPVVTEHGGADGISSLDWQLVREGDAPGATTLTDSKESGMIKAIKFASVPVADQDRALEFYTRSLGFIVATDQPFDGDQRWIELRIPGADTRLALFTPDEHRDRIGTFQNITFVADDVRAAHTELAEAGVEFVQEPQEADWGTAAVFKDSEGNVFVLSSS